MKKTIATHNGKFHADDVFALAALFLVYPESVVIRTRDEEKIKTSDIVADIGGTYDSEKLRFDHHQRGGAGERENGIPYASFGLVWKEFGVQISGSGDIADMIDRKLVQVIDAADNGKDILTPNIKEVFPFTINGIVDSYRLTWKEEGDWDERFMQCVEWAKSLLVRQIKICGDFLEGADIVRKVYEQSENKNLILIDEQYDFGRELVVNILNVFPEVLFVILYRKDTMDWQVVTMRRDQGSFEMRKPLPEEWRAKRDRELEEVSGVVGAKFCHRSGFMVVAKTKEGALALARKALEV